MVVAVPPPPLRIRPLGCKEALWAGVVVEAVARQAVVAAVAVVAARPERSL